MKTARYPEELQPDDGPPPRSPWRGSAVFWALVLLLTIAFAAKACADTMQIACGDREGMVNEVVSPPWEETLLFVTVGDKSIAEVFVNAETGTTTVFVTYPNGRTCRVAAGLAFEMKPQGDPT
jgi:hypothetical protein